MRELLIGWRDWLQVAVILVTIFYCLRALARTQGRNVAFGLAALTLLYGAMKILGLSILAGALENAMRVGVILLVVLFREEARSLLAQLGKQSRKFLLGTDAKTAPHIKVVEEVATAVDRIVKERAGALIAFEVTDRLDDIALTGYRIEAQVSAPLIEAVFTSKSPLHDGAMVIRAQEILAAGAVLPLSKVHDPLPRTGTRHRAALGLSEHTDAAVIVVSEETGRVHVAVDGRFIPVDPEHTRRELVAIIKAEMTGENLEDAGFFDRSTLPTRLGDILERATPKSIWKRAAKK